MRTDTWLLPLGRRLVLGSTDGISIKETNLEALSALEASSVDFYAAMRSAFQMNRQAMVDGSNRIVMREASDDLPDAATDGHTDPVSSAPPSAEPAPLP